MSIQNLLLCWGKLADKFEIITTVEFNKKTVGFDDFGGMPRNRKDVDIKIKSSETRRGKLLWKDLEEVPRPRTLVGFQCCCHEALLSFTF